MDVIMKVPISDTFTDGGDKMLVNIEAERVRKQMTKEEFAKEMGISLKTYYNWINGATAIPSTMLQKIAKFFGVQMEYLLEKREDGEERVRKETV